MKKLNLDITGLKYISSKGTITCILSDRFRKIPASFFSLNFRNAEHTPVS